MKNSPTLADRTGIDTTDLIDRLFRKAEAAALVGDRIHARSQIGFSTWHFNQRRDAIIREAKAHSHYLWMLEHPHPVSADSSRFWVLAGCYETLAEAVATTDVAVNRYAHTSTQVRRALHLLAEAQLALRIAVEDCYPNSDEDYSMAFDLLSRTASLSRVRISFGMALSDVSDPMEFVDIAGRGIALSNEFQALGSRSQRQHQLLDSLRLKVATFTQCDVVTPEGVTEIAAIVSELVDTGLQPSRIEFREAFIGIIDRLPPTNDLPNAIKRVVGETRRWKNSPTTLPDAGRKKEVAPEVQKVAHLLAGKSLVMIGGTERSDTANEITKAFNLKSIDWIATKSHQSYTLFETSIAKPDVAVVLLLIRFASHDFGNCGRFCDLHGKPLVRIPGGYGVNQLASEILNQAGGRLKAAKEQQDDNG